ncbi:MAG: ParB/RepB/Spo0J family partition protein, partial [Pseudomonadota bacterium]
QPGDGANAMTDIIMIPLSKLVPGRRNARKTKPAMSIVELAASIQAHGLLQNLVVAETGDGRYSTEAGGRRLKALRKLAKAKAIAGNMPIPCRVISIENASEASLAENVQREPMHPADEIEAFAQLAEAGHGPEAIAGRFGVNGVHVARRLKLARVSPKLIEAFRKDELNLDQLSALAFSDDHTAQEAAFFNGPEWARTPDRLRAQLAQAHVPETDKLVRFVGIDAYQAAGGDVVTDLFAEDDDSRWLTNRDLLLRLAEAKLGSVADEVRSEGWGWTEIAMDGIAWQQFPERVRESRRDLTAEEEAERERLYAKLDETEDESEIEAIEVAIDALATLGWRSEEVAIAGALVTLSQDGAPKIERGLVRLDDVKALKTARRKFTGVDPTDADHTVSHVLPDQTRRAIPAKLLDELSAHKTLALRAELAKQPALALRVTVFTLAHNAVSEPWSEASCLALAVEQADVGRHITRFESKAPDAYANIAAGWREQLPADVEALWDFVATAEQHTLLELLAVLIAPGIDLLAKSHVQGAAAARIGDLVVEAAGLDMSRWWAATVESYFDHVRKDVIIDAIKEVQPSLDRAKLDKAAKKEVLARAKRVFKGSAWLPEPLRSNRPTSAAVDAIAAE